MQRIATATRALALFGAGKDGFRDGDLAASIIATDFSAAWFNGVQEELMGIIESAGLVADGATLTQVRQGIDVMLRKQAGAVCAVGGTADAITGAFTPAAIALVNGMVVRVRAAFANATTTPTFKADALAAKTIVKGLGVALAAGDIGGAGHWLTLQYDATLDKWVLQNPAGGRLINVQRFTASGTYTPTPGMNYVVVEEQGGGGGGGGSVATAAGQFSVASGGGSGAYGRGRYTAAQVGASQAVTVGAAGVGSAGAGGTNGGSSSFGALLSAPGGNGASAAGVIANTSTYLASPGVPATIATGGTLLNSPGLSGSSGMSLVSGTLSGSGGGAPISGGGGGGLGVGVGSAGAAATAFGAGGGGACGNVSDVAHAGGNGAAGVVIVWEYA